MHQRLPGGGIELEGHAERWPSRTLPLEPFHLVLESAYLAPGADRLPPRKNACTDEDQDGREGPENHTVGHVCFYRYLRVNPRLPRERMRQSERPGFIW